MFFACGGLETVGVVNLDSDTEGEPQTTEVDTNTDIDTGIDDPICAFTDDDATNRIVAPGGDIQTAIDEVNAGGGGTVCLEAGIHLISKSIQMKSEVTLAGAGTTTRLELPDGANYHMIIDDGTQPCENMTIRDLLLDGNIPESSVSNDPEYESPQNSSLGIFFDAYEEENYHTNLIVKNVEIHNTVCAFHIKGVNGGQLDNVYFHHNGVFVVSGHNSLFVRVENYVIQNSRFEDSYNGGGVFLSTDLVRKPFALEYFLH